MTTWTWHRGTGVYYRSYSDTGPALQGDNVQITASNVVVMLVHEYPTPWPEDDTGALENELTLKASGPPWVSGTAPTFTAAGNGLCSTIPRFFMRPMAPRSPSRPAVPGWNWSPTACTSPSNPDRELLFTPGGGRKAWLCASPVTAVLGSGTALAEGFEALRPRSGQSGDRHYRTHQRHGALSGASTEGVGLALGGDEPVPEVTVSDDPGDSDRGFGT